VDYRSVVVVAASAGSLAPLAQLVSLLPKEFPAPVAVLQHLPPSNIYQSMLPEILGRQSRLAVKCIEHGERFLPGTIYLSPQDAQSRIRQNLSFELTPLVRGVMSRPNADSLFESAAKSSGKNAIGIVLSGVLSDGSRGAGLISEAGGRVFAQDRQTAAHFDMPSSAIRKGVVDFAMSPRSIAHALIALLMAPGADAWFRVTKPAQSLASDV
jgi:two-component system, chemotaxis family, protein-glutamate methylesterase/glutaminase